MAYDETLAARIRELLADRDDVEEKRMFGGLTFMVAGRMCCGVNRHELIVRLNPERETEALARPGARPMDFTGRPMRGFVSIEPSALRGPSLRSWVRQAVEYADAAQHR